MEQFKRAKVIMLPTQYNNTQLTLSLGIGEFIGSTIPKGDLCTSSSKGGSNAFRPQHLYIISDDEIKEGDWIYEPEFNTISKAKYNHDILGDKFKKIIATTDTSLTVKGKLTGIGNWYNPLPQPSQQSITKYIESYNKGEVITDVLVEYEYIKTPDQVFYSNDVPYGYNKLKVNPKDNTITSKKLKDNWNREEVIDILNLYSHYVWKTSCNKIELDNWITENL